MSRKLTTLMLLAGLGLSGAAQAGLIDRSGGMIYDTDRNITWLQDANYAMTSGYDADGRMNWNAANTWAGSLTVGGFTDWRLASADPSCNSSGFGYNCTNSDLGHLFYTEGGLSAGQSILASGALTSLFTNMQSYVYWSGTEYAPGTDYAWLFAANGYQDLYDKGQRVLCVGGSFRRCRRHRTGAGKRAAAGVGFVRLGRGETAAWIIWHFVRFGPFGGAGGQFTISPLRFV